MSTWAKRASEIFRAFVTDGVPASGKHKPRKVDIRDWGKVLEDRSGAATTVRVAATGNINLATALAAGQVVDGKTLVAGDPVLAPLQTAPEQNGIYTVPASGAALRRDIFANYDDFPGLIVSVEDGLVNGGTEWRCVSPRGGTIGVSALAFTSRAGAAADSSVRLAAAGNVDLATGLSAGQTVDGKTTVAGDLVLLPFQTVAADKGIYVVPATGAAARAPQYSSFDAHIGKLLTVSEGTDYAGTVWEATAAPGGTLGVTDLAFSHVSGARFDALFGVIAATITADQVDYAPAGIHRKTVVRLDAADGALFSFHGLGAGVAGETKLFENRSSAAVFVFKDQSSSATAANRFTLGEDVWLAPGEAMVVEYDVDADRWAKVSGPESDSALFDYPFDGLPNGDFSIWTTRPASGSKQTAGAGLGFSPGDIFDGWYGGPGVGSQYTVTDVLEDAATNGHAIQIAWNAAVNDGEEHHKGAQIASGYWRFSFMEYIGRFAPEYVAGQTITIEFDAKIGSASAAPKLVPIAWLSMGNAPWQASTSYLVGEYRTNGSAGEFTNAPRVYRCTTAGTSASSGGPTSTSASISDGTCVWTYVGEWKGREYELYEPGADPAAMQIAWGDPHANALCTLGTGYQTFRKQIYVPRLNEGTGTRYAGQPNDAGSRVLTPPRGGGAYWGIGFDLYHNAATGPTITIKDLDWWVGKRRRARKPRWPRDLALLAANGFQRMLALYSSTQEATSETVIASASTVDIGGAATTRIAISGTTTITSFGSTPNKVRFVRFTGSGLTITHGAAMWLPGGQNIVTALNDTAIFASDSSGNWMLQAYKRQDGAPFGVGLATIASASTTDLGSKIENSVTVSGTTTITSFGSTAPTGIVKFVQFSGALTLTHNATSLIVPGGANIVTAAGDCLTARHEGSGNWRVLTFTRASGAAAVEGQQEAESTVASASTCDIGAANTEKVNVTGTTTITSFGARANKLRRVRFSGALTLTHNGTSLILLGGVDRLTAAGDVGWYESDGSGNWRELTFERASGRMPIGTPGWTGTRYNTGGLMIVGAGTVALAANRLWAVPFLIGTRKTWTKIGIEITTGSAGNARLGIYNAGTDGLPGSLVIDAGTVSTASVAVVEATISRALDPGFYYLALVADNTATVRAYTGVGDLYDTWIGAESPSAKGETMFRSFTYGALPDPWGTPSFTPGFGTPTMWLRTA